MRYRWEYHPNRQMATLHLDRIVPKIRYEFERLSASFIGNTEPTEEARRLGEALLAIPGIEKFSAGSNRYQISITKGGVFDWFEVQEPVVAAVAYVLDPDGEEPTALAAIGYGQLDSFAENLSCISAPSTRVDDLDADAYQEPPGD